MGGQGHDYMTATELLEARIIAVENRLKQSFEADGASVVCLSRLMTSTILGDFQ
jgi:hypothetical protein